MMTPGQRHRLWVIENKAHRVAAGLGDLAARRIALAQRLREVEMDLSRIGYLGPAAYQCQLVTNCSGGLGGDSPMAGHTLTITSSMDATSVDLVTDASGLVGFTGLTPGITYTATFAGNTGDRTLNLTPGSTTDVIRLASPPFPYICVPGCDFIDGQNWNLLASFGDLTPFPNWVPSQDRLRGTFTLTRTACYRQLSSTTQCDPTVLDDMPITFTVTLTYTPSNPFTPYVGGGFPATLTITMPTTGPFLSPTTDGILVGNNSAFATSLSSVTNTPFEAVVAAPATCDPNQVDFDFGAAYPTGVWSGDMADLTWKGNLLDLLFNGGSKVMSLVRP